MCKGTGGIEQKHETAQSGPYKKVDVAEVSEMRWHGWNLNLERQPEVLPVSRGEA